MGGIGAKIKEFWCRLIRNCLWAFLSDRQPSTLDKELFAKTLAKVFKKLGVFRHDEGEDWQHALIQLESLVGKEEETESIIAEHFDEMRKDWNK